MLIKPELLTNWKTATKTRNIIARPLCTLIIDSDIATKLLLKTLEGNQEIAFSKSDTMVCVGASTDVWQQDKKKLLQKYDVVDFTTDGWMICKPKPDNEVEVVEITELILALTLNPTDAFTIEGQWGQPSDDGKFLQFGNIGDFICRNPKDHTDNWIVKKFLFRSTYVVTGEVDETSDLSNVIPFRKVA